MKSNFFKILDFADFAVKNCFLKNTGFLNGHYDELQILLHE